MKEQAMLFQGAAYVGVDCTAGKRPMHFAALDESLGLSAIDSGSMEEVLAFVGGLGKAVVAVDAPQSPNQGLLLRPQVRRQYNLRPGGTTWGKWKLCEYELRRRNIRLYNTPGSVADAPRWMQNGFLLYERLKMLGFSFFQQGEQMGERSMLEVHPHACYAVLLEHRPFLKQTLEGRMQRQLVLYLEGLDIPNPLRTLEEITRHRLLSGELPLPTLYDHDQLDALVAAFTAYLVAKQPERVSQVGDVEEGLITLPAAELKDFYS
jgi:predicted nuclease with RNAse H fold